MPTPDDFNGTNKLDVRDSPPDGTAFTAAPAPDGGPNVLVVLFDDTGIAAWSPYGGRIDMPTIDKLAADGLTYSQRHTTALCSPTRSTFLAGRNHHLNGFASIAETANPGIRRTSRPTMPPIATVLRDSRYGTGVHDLSDEQGILH